MDKKKNKHVGKELLEFYSELPFNYPSSPDVSAQDIKSANTLGYYFGAYESLFIENCSVLEIGCGIGWMANMVSYYRKASVTAFDFNPKVVGFAEEVAEVLAASDRSFTKPLFRVADLFKYEAAPYDIVYSIGVLNHKGYFTKGVTKACQLTRSKGHIILGLYHYHGRAPFLNHFKELEKSGCSEDQLLEEYKRLDPRHQDETLAKSWFHDQVQNIYETQHTLEELDKVFSDNNVKVIASSLNSFQSYDKIEELFKLETAMYDKGMTYLRDGVYFPGFFITVVEKI